MTEKPKHPKAADWDARKDAYFERKSQRAKEGNDIGELLQPFIERASELPAVDTPELELSPKQERVIYFKIRLKQILDNLVIEKGGKEFIITKEVKELLAATMRYFTVNDAFLTYDRFLNHPTMSKGLLIIGGYGIGKTTILRAFKKLWDEIPDHYPEAENRFMFRSCMDIARNQSQYEYQKRITRTDQHLCIDDLGREIQEKIIEYGKTPLANILHFRMNRIGLRRRLIISSNLSFEEIAENYGNAIADRLIESCNIVNLEGIQSFRR